MASISKLRNLKRQQTGAQVRREGALKTELASALQSIKKELMQAIVMGIRVDSAKQVVQGTDKPPTDPVLTELMQDIKKGLTEDLEKSIRESAKANAEEIDKLGARLEGALEPLNDVVKQQPIKAVDEKVQDILSSRQSKLLSTQFEKPGTTWKERTKDFLKGSAMTAVGLGDMYRFQKERNLERDSYVESQRQLRPEMSEKDLRQEWKNREDYKSNLEVAEAKYQDIKASGDFTPQELQKLDISKERRMWADFIQPDQFVRPQGVLSVSEEVQTEAAAQTAAAANEEQKQTDAAQLQVEATGENTKILVEIRDILKEGAASSAAGAAEGGSGGILSSATDLLGGGVKKAGSILGRAGSALMKGAGAAGRWSTSAGGLKALKIGGSALAIGTGAYTAYKGFTGAEGERAATAADVEKQIESGAISKEEGAAQLKAIEEGATEKKGGAIGEGAGMAAGGVAGALKGAAIGSFFGPAGTIVGGAIGGTAGAFLGSSVGKTAGEYAGKGVNWLKETAGASKLTTEAQSAPIGAQASLRAMDKDVPQDTWAKDIVGQGTIKLIDTQNTNTSTDASTTTMHQPIVNSTYNRDVIASSAARAPNIVVPAAAPEVRARIITSGAPQIISQPPVPYARVRELSPVDAVISGATRVLGQTVDNSVSEQARNIRRSAGGGDLANIISDIGAGATGRAVRGVLSQDSTGIGQIIGGRQSQPIPSVRADMKVVTQPSQQLSQPLPDTTSVEAAAAMAKNISMPVPAPIVIPTAPHQQIVTTPFSQNIRNSESTMQSYIRARYVG